MKKRKILCLLLAMIMALSMALPTATFADDELYEEVEVNDQIEYYEDEEPYQDLFEEVYYEDELYEEFVENEICEIEEQYENNVTPISEENAFSEDVIQAVESDEPLVDGDYASEQVFELSEAEKFSTNNPAASITTQPTNQIAARGQTVTFTVEATNATKYQWQVDRNDGKGFVNLSESSVWKGTKTDSFSFPASAARAAFTFRVVVSNAASFDTSDEVQLIIAAAPTITTHPTNQTVASGQTVTFTVEAENAENYQWQVDRNDGKGFVNLSESNVWMGTKTKSFSFPASAARAAFTFRVVVSNAAGFDTSDEVQLIIAVAPTITTQPTNQTVASGQTVTFTVEAENAEDYQWQVDRNDGKGFVNLSESNVWMGTKTKSFSFPASAARAAFTFRVVVSNAAGFDTSDEVQLIIAAAPTITTQPTDQLGWIGKTVTFTVVSQNATEWQWQYSDDEGNSYHNTDVEGYNTETITVTLDETNITYYWQCVLTGQGDTSLTSGSAKVFTKIVDGAFTYEALSETTCSLFKYSGNESNLIVNEYFQGMQLIEIGEKAFEDNTALVSIDLPDSIQIIGKRAFAGCVNLKNMS